MHQMNVVHIGSTHQMCLQDNCAGYGRFDPTSDTMLRGYISKEHG